MEKKAKMYLDIMNHRISDHTNPAVWNISDSKT